jgi:hypothetical protein
MADLPIETVANGFRSAKNDEGEVVQHSLEDLIAADKYLSARAAQSTNRFPIRLAKIKPGSGPL